MEVETENDATLSSHISRERQSMPFRTHEDTVVGVREQNSRALDARVFDLDRFEDRVGR